MEPTNVHLTPVPHADSCETCGECCHQPIPLTVPDVGHLARGLELTEAEAFRRFVSPPDPSRPQVFTQTRNERGACYFLSADNHCTVHGFKPRSCAMFPCPRLQRKDRKAWAKLYVSGLTPLSFWRQKLAEQVTRQYLEQYGTGWNAPGYQELLATFERALAAKATELAAERGQAG